MNVIEIPINPIPWKRAQRKGKIYFDGQISQKDTFRWHFINAVKPILKLSTPFKLSIQYEVPMPQSWSLRKRLNKSGTPHSQIPDLDNLIKFVGDTLQGIAWEDDNLIYEINARKIWAQKGMVKLQIEEYKGNTFLPIFRE